MNDIINDVNDLKENILKSSEYLNFKKSEKNLDNNKEVNKIITDIIISEPANPFCSLKFTTFSFILYNYKIVLI